MKTRDTILSMMNVKKYMINSVTGKYYGITNMRINVRTYLDTSTLTISRKQVVTIARIIAKSYVIIQTKSNAVISTR